MSSEIVATPTPEPPPAAAPALAQTARNLDKSLVHGIAWTASVQWMTQLLSWSATWLVAAILGPANYGIVAMAAVFTAFVEMVSDFGMGQAVVKHRELTEHQIAQVNSVCVLFGLSGWAISCAAAYPISLIYGVPAVTAVVIVSSSSFLFSSFRSVPLSLMERDLQFRNIAINNAIQGTVLPISMVVFAVVLHLEYWSLVFGSVLTAILTSMLAVRVRPTRFAWPRIADLQGVLSFGSHMVVQRFAYYLTTSSDIFIGAKILGQAPVGNYTFAMSIAAMPSEKISGMAMRVMPPIISAVQRDLVQLRRYVLAFTEVVSLLTVPVGVGLILVAPDLVPWLLPKYTAAIVPLQLLAMSGVHRSTTPILPSTAWMTGLSSVAMRIALAISLIMPVLFFLGSHWGLAGISSAWLIGYPLLCVPFYVVVFRRIELTSAAYFKALAPAMTSAAIMAASVWLGHHYLYFNAPIPVRVVSDVAVGALTYGLSLLTFHRSRLLALRSIYRIVRSK